MASLVYALNQSLDGYVDHDRFAPPPALFQHFIDEVRCAAGMVYGRTLYEIMRYWDDDQPDWGEPERAYAEAWRSKPKWVVSRTLTSVGPNATLLRDDIEATLRQLKAGLTGELELGGTVLAQSLATSGLIDTYRMYLHPVVLGSGKPYFAGPVPPLRFLGSEDICEGIVRLTYAP
ncbi:dihydrofolate reductase family protein [Bacillus sp. NP157]|nr:dihydrofolate reductase family protein [Bacillus sp. NP157]